MFFARKKKKTRLTQQTQGRIYNNHALRTLTPFHCTIVLRTGTVANHSKLPPTFFFFCKEMKTRKTKTENTALRDKSAQNCAKTSQNSYGPIVKKYHHHQPSDFAFQNSSTFFNSAPTFAHLRLTCQNKSPRNENTHPPLKCLQVMNTPNNGGKMLTLLRHLYGSSQLRLAGLHKTQQDQHQPKFS